MNDSMTETHGHDNMEVLAQTVNEEVETEVDDKLLDELVHEEKKLEIKNMIDTKVFDVVKRPNGKKVIDGRWLLSRNGLDEDVDNEFFAGTPLVSSFRCQLPTASATLQQ